jgi:hypothetical protein
VFHGTKGWIGDVCSVFCASDEDLWLVNFKASEERLPVSPEHNRNFIDCVRSRAQPICPVEMAIRCDTICPLARAAALTGKVVNWDPRKEEVAGDNPEASKMLSLPYREKWKVW